MKTFSIFVDNFNKKTILIEESFSFLALIFQVIWLVYHKIWLQAFIYIALRAAVYFATNYNLIIGELAIALEIIFAFTIGIFAKTWYIEKLKKNNFKLHSIVVALNEDQARLRYYQTNKDFNYVR